MASSFDKFVAYGTDLAGLERFLRGLQAVCSILISFPPLLALVAFSSPEPVRISTALGLGVLRGQLNVTRRFLRSFRWVDGLRAGWDLFFAEPKSLDTWMDIVGKTSLGLFGFMETITLLDLIGIEGIRLFGRERAEELDMQSQYFWFLGLYLSVISTGMKLFRLFATRAVPKTAEEYSTVEVSVQDAASEKDTKNVSEKAEPKPEKKEPEGDETPEEALAKERQRLKGVIAKRKAERRAWLRYISAEATAMGRTMLSDSLDMILPCSAVGWISVSSGVIAWVMFFTTITTSMPIWNRVGKQLNKK